MDAAALTSLVMGVLTPLAPYLSSAGTALTGKVGEDLYQQGKRLFEAVRARFAKEPDGGKASQALQLFLDDPDAADTVEKKLFRLLVADPTFAQALRQLIQTGPRQSLTVEEEAEARRIRMSNPLGIGTQEITERKRAKIEDVDMQMGSE